jgi:hypothetical protein
MSYDLIFLLEEPSMKTVLKTILPKLIPEQITYISAMTFGLSSLRDAPRWRNLRSALTAIVIESLMVLITHLTYIDIPRLRR